jgi:hypothetical protein
MKQNSRRVSLFQLGLLPLHRAICGRLLLLTNERQAHETEVGWECSYKLLCAHTRVIACTTTTVLFWLYQARGLVQLSNNIVSSKVNLLLSQIQSPTLDNCTEAKKRSKDR